MRRRRVHGRVDRAPRAAGGLATTLLDAFGAATPGRPRATRRGSSAASHGDDQLYSRGRGRRPAAWIALGEQVGESSSFPAGVLWFAHGEDGFERASETLLGAIGIPVEHLRPAEVAGALAADRGRRPGLRDLRTRGRPADGAPGHRGGRPPVHRARAAGSSRLGRPGRSDGDRLLEVVDRGRPGRSPRTSSCSRPGRGCRGSSPGLLGDVIRVTKQDVVFVGPAPGDDRFDPTTCRAGSTTTPPSTASRRSTAKGIKLAPDRYGPVFDPTHGERIVDPESVRLARRYVARRFPGLADAPVVESRVCQYETTPDTHFVIDRHPDFDNVLAGRWRLRPWLQARPVDRRARRRAADRPAGEPGRGAVRPWARARVPGRNLRTGADTMVQGWSDW